MDITRQILNTIRSKENNSSKAMNESKTKDMSLTILENIRLAKKNIIKEDNQTNNSDNSSINIDKINAFASTITDWKNNIKQNIQSNIDFNSFVYYPSQNDIVVNFSIIDMNNAKVQMRLNDSSGNGIYVWLNGVQLNDINLPKIQHIKASYDNWRSGLIKDSTILEDLNKFIENKI